MRLRLFHQIFGLIAAASMLSAIAVAAALGGNLRRGFTDYLVARDDEDLQRFAAAAEAALEESGDASALSTRKLDIVMLLERAHLGVASELRKRPPPPLAADPPAEFLAGSNTSPSVEATRPAGPVARGPAPPARPLHSNALARPPEDFAGRLMIFDIDGRQIAGPPPPPSNRLAVAIPSAPIRLDGKVVGTVKVLPRAHAPEGVDSRFLASQSRSAAILAGAIVLLGAIPAWLVSRAAAKRLEEMQTATRAVANGDFSVALPERSGGEIDDLARNINVMTASLRRLDALRRRWFAEASHELRTPLAAFRAEIESMIDGVRPLSQAGLSSIHDETLRLSALVEDLHQLAVSHLQERIYAYTEVDAATLVRSAAARFRPSAQAHGLSLDCAEAGRVMTAYWDEARFDQALGNLLSNSIRYTDAPGLIRIGLERRDKGIRIIVEDTAPCPDAEHLPRLFEPLYRLDEARSRANGGSGMGLAICEAIVKAHGGAITAARSALGGLSIVIDMPADSRANA